MLNAEIAQIAFESIRVLRDIVKSPIDGPERYSWASAPAWVKEAFIRGVKFIRENRDATDEEHHQDWLEVRVANGWKYGPKKILADKVSPYMAPFEELPIEQIRKIILFRSIVEALC